MINCGLIGVGKFGKNILKNLKKHEAIKDIYLCDTNLQNGCLEFSPLNNNVVLENKNGIILEEEKLDWISCPTNFGDIVLFNSYIPHRSGSNKMDKPRKSFRRGGKRTNQVHHLIHCCVRERTFG